MVLVDISSLFHKVTHGLSGLLLKQNKEIDFIDFKLYKKEFNNMVINLLCEHLERFRPYWSTFADVVICLDDKSTKGNWRKQFYPMYKAQRTKFRQSQTKFDYEDAYAVFNKFIDHLRESKIFKVVGLDGAEADDVIMILAKNDEPTLILSPDKDFIQLQKWPNVKQYSWMTNKMIEIPQEEMQSWLLEHICTGDTADNVPRIVDFAEFNPGVREYLIESGRLGENDDAFEFSCSFYDPEEFEPFGGAFKKERFGMSILNKQIAKLGSFEAFLKSNSTFERNYYRNRQLVLEEFIPAYIREDVMKVYAASECDGSIETFVDEGNFYVANLHSLISDKYISSKQLSDFMDW